MASGEVDRVGGGMEVRCGYGGMGDGRRKGS